MTIELVEVTRANVEAVLALEVAPAQRGLVSPNAKSIAQGVFEPQARFRAVYADDRAVGFVLWIEPEDADYLYVWRLMIDAGAQGRGHGRGVIEALGERARGLGYAALYLSHQQTVGNAGPFYEGLGFVPTGEVRDGERYLRLELAPRR